MSDASVIDSLVVTLGLDPKAFTTGQKDAMAAFKRTKEQATATAKEMEARGQQAAQFFGSIKKEALGLFAVIVGAGGIEQFTAKTVTNFAGIARQAQIMGIEVQKLQAILLATERNGGDKAAGASSLLNLAQVMEVYKTRGQIAPQLLSYFNQIGGVNPTDGADKVFEKYAAWAAAHRKNPRFVNQVGQGLGLDQGLINLALQTNVPAELAKSRKIGGIPTDADIQHVTALQQAFFTLRQTIAGDANELLFGFSPALTGIIKGVDTLASANKGLTKTLLALGAAISTFLGLEAVANVLKLFGIKSPAAALRTARVGATRAAGGAARSALGLVPTGAGAAIGGGILLSLVPTGLGDSSHQLSADQRARRDAWMKANPGKPIPFGFDDRAGERGGNGLFSGLESKYGLPSGTLDALWYQESRRGKYLGPSTAGALGQFQFMPKVASQYGVADPNSLGQSASGAAHLFHDLLRHYHGDVAKSIAGYNEGQGNLDKNIAKHGSRWRDYLPPETKAYLASVGRRITNVNISAINVQTNATDPKTIAAGISGALKANLARQANAGLSG